MQLLAPDDYAKLELKDQWIENVMQEYEGKLILGMTGDCNYYLELGYGAGIITRALIAAGKEVSTVDGSAEFCEAAYEDGADPVHHCMFEDFDPGWVNGGAYDCVIASFVLEHVQDPVKLLMRATQWANRLIVVIGNANSYHRQLAVKMGLQSALDTLSERDKQVGHYRVYDLTTITNDLAKSGWMRIQAVPLMFKPLPNSMMTGFKPELIHAMCQIPVPLECAANIIIECRKF